LAEEPIPFHRAGRPPATVRQEGQRPSAEVTFDRGELDIILQFYARCVAAGVARDYAIGFGTEAASFAIFRRTAEVPLWRVEKRPRLRKAQGQWAVVAAGGLILKRGHELRQVLKVLEPKLLKAVD